MAVVTSLPTPTPATKPAKAPRPAPTPNDAVAYLPSASCTTVDVSHEGSMTVGRGGLPKMSRTRPAWALGWTGTAPSVGERWPSRRHSPSPPRTGCPGGPRGWLRRTA